MYSVVFIVSVEVTHHISNILHYYLLHDFYAFTIRLPGIPKSKHDMLNYEINSGYKNLIGFTIHYTSTYYLPLALLCGKAERRDSIAE